MSFENTSDSPFNKSSYPAVKTNHRLPLRYALGSPLPATRHAISVSLPKWEDVVGYEKNEPRVLTSLAGGYPRFFLHSFVQTLINTCQQQLARENEFCTLAPSLKVAQACVAYVLRRTQLSGRIVPHPSGVVWSVTFPDQAAVAAREFWQHRGDLVSSRRAAHALGLSSAKVDANLALKTVKQQIQALTCFDSQDIYLFPSGMSAISQSVQVLKRVFQSPQVIQFGFPYIDSPKLFEKIGEYKVRLIPDSGQAGLKQLSQYLELQRPAAVFVEAPSNPLLQTADFERLSQLLKQHKVALIVDDTIGSFGNINLKPYADILVSSLSKYFSGYGDVLAGSLCLNRQSPWYQQFKEILSQEYENNLWAEDAIVLAKNCRDYSQRLNQINDNTLAVVEYLTSQSEVLKLHYPAVTTPKNYNRIKRQDAGFSGLFSMQLRNPKRAEQFYNALQIAKGAGFGNTFSLAIPYTQIAHFNELSWASDCGVVPDLIRVSIGVESRASLIDCFRIALEESK